MAAKEFVTVDEKGEIIIPKKFIKELGLKPHSVRRVWEQHDTIFLRKLNLSELRKEWEKIFEAIDGKKIKMSKQEILDEIQAYRAEKRSRSKK